MIHINGMHTDYAGVSICEVFCHQELVLETVSQLIFLSLSIFKNNSYFLQGHI